jgi:hypothetical protein
MSSLKAACMLAQRLMNQLLALEAQCMHQLGEEFRFHFQLIRHNQLRLGGSHKHRAVLLQAVLRRQQIRKRKSRCGVI